VAIVLGMLTACSAEGQTTASTSMTESDESPSTVAADVPSPTEIDSPALSAPTTAATSERVTPTMETFPVPPGSRPHDVWAATTGDVWYTGQGRGVLGVVDPGSGEVEEIPLGDGSRPHGVIEGPDGAAWITDGGLDAIVRVDVATGEVTAYPLPDSYRDANLNTATFDAKGTLWFTGQTGVYGRLRADVTRVEAFDAPGGGGPYGITATDHAVYYASLAGSHMGRIDPDTADVIRLDPPTPDQGTRRVWGDSAGRIWSSQWNTGQVAVYDPTDGSWQEWPLPGDAAQAYAVFVDDRDVVWLSDFIADAVVSFDPTTETFESFPLPGDPGEVRQIHGRPGEVWLPESAADQLVVLRTDEADPAD
jgi:virginiamycin B lyase